MRTDSDVKSTHSKILMPGLFADRFFRLVCNNASQFASTRKFTQLQTLSTDTSMSPREGSSVPVGLLYTSIPSCCMTTPAFSRSSSAGGSATSAQHVRPSGIRCRWPDDLQRCARWVARPHRQHNNFQTTFKDTFFLELSTRLAHLRWRRNALYKSTLLPHLLYNVVVVYLQHGGIL